MASFSHLSHKFRATRSIGTFGVLVVTARAGGIIVHAVRGMRGWQRVRAEGVPTVVEMLHR